jgi:hypothetical protein
MSCTSIRRMIMSRIFNYKKIIIGLAIIFSTFFLFGTNQADAAWSAIQTATQVTGNTTTANLTLTSTTAGNLVVVYGRCLSSETLNSVTDSAGNTYAIIGPITNSTRFYMAYGVQTTGGTTTVTLTFSAAGSKRTGADEYHSSNGSLASNAAAFDATTSGTGTGTAAATSTLTPAATGELIIGATAVGVAATMTAGTGFTAYSGGGSTAVTSEYKLSGAATETAPMTISTSAAWVDIAAAFKEPSVSLVKTRNGLSWASVKSMYGLAVASVKKVNGLAAQ